MREKRARCKHELVHVIYTMPHTNTLEFSMMCTKCTNHMITENIINKNRLSKQ